jgi:putative transposase
LSDAQNPNELWCADYKGEFRLGNKLYGYPLTITDYRSRYLLACEALDSTKEPPAFSLFERIFKEFGLPAAIRTDNGVPFSNAHTLFGLSKLSVWWLRLGISIERIKPGKPQQNGRHERMHLTLKKETTKPAAYNFLQQQERFDGFMKIYNNDRPHQALGGLYPAEVYTPSAREFRPPAHPEYPFHDRSVRVTQCGRICIGKRKISLSRVFAGQYVGIREVADDIWLVSFMDYDLGFFDNEVDRVEPVGENPFAPKVLPMSPV